MDSPIDCRNMSDPGDEVLHKFRYQHAYGVILAVGLTTKKLDYTAIWCEQNEDFLAETSEGFFDAYQIKTRRSELGAWQINHEAFWKSIARFVKLDLAYPSKIRCFKFVSNTEFSDSNAEQNKHFSPYKLRNGVKSVTQWDELVDAAKDGFSWLKNKLGEEATALFSVLKRLDIVLGPTSRAFEDEIALRHIATLDECKSMSALFLSRVSDALIARIAKASSLVSDDPTRDWIGLTCKLNENPFLLAKRITSEDVKLIVRDNLCPGFNYLPELASLQLSSHTGEMEVLRKKMSRGGLALYSEIMRRRALTAEQELFDLATRPNMGRKKISQIENVVLGECSDAYLRASQKSEPYGPSMLIDVQDRLKDISSNNPAKVYNRSYDCLLGVAGLLTSECKVWWSEKFELETENES